MVDHRDRRDHRPVPDRVPALEPAHEDDDPGAEPEHERDRPQAAQVARSEEAPPAARRRRRGLDVGVLGLRGDRGHCPPPWDDWIRYRTSVSRSAFEITWPKFEGMTPFGKPGSMYASGSTIGRVDEVLERLSGLLGLGRQLVEVGTDLADRAGGGERVAALAAVRVEDRLAVGRAALAGCSGGAGRARRPARRRRRRRLRGRRLRRGTATVRPVLVGEARGREHDRRAAHERVPEAAELGADDRVGAELRRRDLERVRLAGHGVLLLTELGHPERVQHVLGLDLQNRGAVDRHVEVRRDDAFGRPVLVLEEPGELLGDHVDVERVLRRRPVVVQHDRADDGDHRDERGRDRRPDDLQAGVAVDRRPVAIVVGMDAEAPDRVEDRGRDDREDHDRDPGRQPEGHVDPVALLRRRNGEPRNEDRDGRGGSRDHGGEQREMDELSPPHRRGAAY